MMSEIGEQQTELGDSVLGPLPEETDLYWDPNGCSYVTGYTKKQMRAYASAQVAAKWDAIRNDAERWRVMRDRCAWTMVSNRGIVRVTFRVPVEWEDVAETGDDLNDLADAALAPPWGGDPA